MQSQEHTQSLFNFGTNNVSYVVHPIYLYGSPILQKPTENLDIEFLRDNLEAYNEIVKLCNDMNYMILYGSALGLAANQIGISKSFFVINKYILDNEDDNVFLNPNIISYGDELIESSEECLSIPGFSETVYRAKTIEVEYYSINLEHKTKTIDYPVSIVFQHEYDHLDGVLFVDKVDERRKTKLLKNLKIFTKKKRHPNYPHVYQV